MLAVHRLASRTRHTQKSNVKPRSRAWLERSGNLPRAATPPIRHAATEQARTELKFRTNVDESQRGFHQRSNSAGVAPNIGRKLPHQTLSNASSQLRLA